MATQLTIKSSIRPPTVWYRTSPFATTSYIPINYTTGRNRTITTITKVTQRCTASLSCRPDSRVSRKPKPPRGFPRKSFPATAWSSAAQIQPRALTRSSSVWVATVTANRRARAASLDRSLRRAAIFRHDALAAALTRTSIAIKGLIDLLTKSIQILHTRTIDGNPSVRNYQ